MKPANFVINNPLPCEHCGELVDYPFPMHRKCGEIWLKGFHAGQRTDRGPMLDITAADLMRMYDETITTSL